MKGAENNKSSNVKQQENKKYISLKKAAQYSEVYSRDYLSLRARQGKLKAVKLGRNWVTTKEWMDEYLERVKKYNESKQSKKEYISLKKAAQYSEVYSQDYLSLRARQGKLKAVKLGRNWVTTREWVDDYLENITRPKKEPVKVQEPVQFIAPQWNWKRIAAVGLSLFCLIFLASFLISEKPAKFVGNLTGNVVEVIKENIEQERVAQGFFYSFRQGLSQGLDFVLRPWKKSSFRVLVLEREQEPRKEPEVVEEKIIETHPVQKIVQQIIKTDNTRLDQLALKIKEMQEWESDILSFRNLSQKLQSYPPQTTHPQAPVYIGSPGIQVGGNAVFSALSVSGSAGIKDLGVGDSTTLGSDASDLLTVNATANFLGPVNLSNSFSAPGFGIDTDGNVTIEGDLTVSGTLTAAGVSFSNTTLSASSTDPVFIVDQTGSGDVVHFRTSGENVFVISNDGSMTLVGTSTASTFISTSTDSTVRKSGEEVFRGSASIYRYDMPSQTSTTTYFRVSKNITANPFSSSPDPLPGSERVYRLIIKYADDLSAASSSLWRVYDVSNASSSDNFTLSGLNASDMSEGTSYVTEVLNIPSTEWTLELQSPSAAKTIRVFQVFLAAYDRIN